MFTNRFNFVCLRGNYNRTNLTSLEKLACLSVNLFVYSSLNFCSALKFFRQQRLFNQKNNYFEMNNTKSNRAVQPKMYAMTNRAFRAEISARSCSFH